MKGVDRKTSLLQFVVESLIKRHGEESSIAALSQQLAAVKPASNLQVRTEVLGTAQVKAGKEKLAYVEPQLTYRLYVGLFDLPVKNDRR